MLGTSMVLMQLHSYLYRWTHLFLLRAARRLELELCCGARILPLLSLVVKSLLLVPREDGLPEFSSDLPRRQNQGVL